MGACGLRVWDASGNLQVEISSRLSKIVGSYKIDGVAASGAITDPLLANAAIWTSFQANFTWGYTNMDISRPNFSVSGNTISWFYSPGAGTHNVRIPGILFYGVY